MGRREGEGYARAGEAQRCQSWVAAPRQELGQVGKDFGGHHGRRSGFHTFYQEDPDACPWPLGLGKPHSPGSLLWPGPSPTPRLPAYPICTPRGSRWPQVQVLSPGMASALIYGPNVAWLRSTLLRILKVCAVSWFSLLASDGSLCIAVLCRDRVCLLAGSICLCSARARW